MNRTLIMLALAGLFAVQAHRPEPSKPVAVVELFTSQGCSSCPPADRLLTEVSRQAVASGQSLYALSFHVDYWDRLGWRDPYSDAKYTARQQQYARQFKLGSIYTPQAVLNGKREFVGSNRAQMTSLLADALRETPPVAVQLTANQQGKTITVNYKLAGRLAGTVLNVALVSQTTTTVVSRGENAGHTLTHNNVVRAFATVPTSETGQTTLTAPADFDPTNGAVIAYVQQANTLTTLGAGRVALEK
ncbi:DUF1223 domain-containing protein [Fibrella aquatilis]|uniref:DUF1223 domain-containing protein n=1 Tax=Fibrella aquatilis TaxID=2817059 RepID=A0A939K2J2_9BACT|nr:DUF1223 domain-containing protein [Fibrella aquatilis]MBO0934136.1 DUF1223 domain-containing protein [Fibrella aquatilis]